LESVIARYEELDRFLGGQYHERIEKAICVRSYEAAMECEARGALQSARRHLSRALSGRPDWLATYVARHGLTPEEFRAMLSRRVWLYSNPALFRLASLAERLRKRAQWRRIKRSVERQTRLRGETGAGVGSIQVSPNPAPPCARYPHLAAITVSWTVSRIDTLEVRVGTPDGLLLSRAHASGTVTTGEWVSDGMLFYLQDVSGGAPLTLAHTLDAVSVALRASQTR
jgi:hypothetical protein